MAKVIMVQGTMSNVGKSLVTAGLCRVFAQDGYRVAPFKSQNMALNSYITEEGLELGRAQAMQAEAAKIKPLSCMNPILLKPTDDVGSQVIVNGKVLGNMKAREYFAYKTKLIPEIKKAFQKLSEMADIIVIEGAGSPAEINLKENDIVNMGMAAMVDAPVILVGDIDRGGVFAQLLGTIELLEEEEKARIKGLVINKFRGDKSILDPGITMLEEKGGIPVVGTLPYTRLQLEDEDSLSEKLEQKEVALIDIAVIRLPHISNFTDFDTFEQMPQVSVRYINNPREFGCPDLVILPGSKSTMADLKWLRESGMEVMIKKAAAKETPIIGICGGYQMLGLSVADPDHVESSEEQSLVNAKETGFLDTIRGLGLLPVETLLGSSKKTEQYEGKVLPVGGIFEELSGLSVSGYEIHMGETKPCEELAEFTEGQSGYAKENIYGSYVHGLFDRKEVAVSVVRSLAKKKGIDSDFSNVMDYAALKEREYDKLADMIRESMDMDAIYGMLSDAKTDV